MGLLGLRQQAASGFYVFSSGFALSADQPVALKALLEAVRSLLAGPVEWFPGYFVAGDQIDPAFEAVQEPCGSFRVGRTVVEVFYQDVFEGKPALAVPRILP